MLVQVLNDSNYYYKVVAEGSLDLPLVGRLVIGLLP